MAKSGPSTKAKERREYAIALLLLAGYSAGIVCFGLALYWWVADDSLHWVLGTGMFGFGVVISATAAATTAFEWALRQPKYANKVQLLQMIELNVQIAALVPMLGVVTFTAALQVLMDNEDEDGDIGWSTVAVALVALCMTGIFGALAAYFAYKNYSTYMNTAKEGQSLLEVASDEDSDLGFTDLISTSLPAHSSGGAVQAFM